MHSSLENAQSRRQYKRICNPFAYMGARELEARRWWETGEWLAEAWCGLLRWVRAGGPRALLKRHATQHLIIKERDPAAVCRSEWS